MNVQATDIVEQPPSPLLAQRRALGDAIRRRDKYVEGDLERRRVELHQALAKHAYRAKLAQQAPGWARELEVLAELRPDCQRAVELRNYLAETRRTVAPAVLDALRRDLATVEVEREAQRRRLQADREEYERVQRAITAGLTTLPAEADPAADRATVATITKRTTPALPRAAKSAEAIVVAGRAFLASLRAHQAIVNTLDGDAAAYSPAASRLRGKGERVPSFPVPEAVLYAARGRVFGDFEARLTVLEQELGGARP